MALGDAGNLLPADRGAISGCRVRASTLDSAPLTGTLDSESEIPVLSARL